MIESIDLHGKTAVITGATSGIGLAATVALASSGARVMGVGRNDARCKSAEASILAVYPDAQVSYLLADLSLQSQVRRLVADIRQQLSDLGSSSLDLLVNVAGLYSQNFVRTSEGIELTLAVNHLAAFLLTNQLLPLLMASPDARILTVSSGSHFGTGINLQRLNSPRPYFGLWAYKVSKLANVLFTLELRRHLEGTNVSAYVVDPGLVNTAIASKGRPGISGVIWNWRSKKGTSPEAPARTILYLSGEPSLKHHAGIYWYNLMPVATSRQAQDKNMARDLWKKSLELCHLDGQMEEA